MLKFTVYMASLDRQKRIFLNRHRSFRASIKFLGEIRFGAAARREATEGPPEERAHCTRCLEVGGLAFLLIRAWDRSERLHRMEAPTGTGRFEKGKLVRLFLAGP